MERPDDPRRPRSNRRRAEQTAQTLIAALLLGTTSGCATVDMTQPRPVYAPRPAARPVTVVLVQRGDTVAGIARRYGLSAHAIAEANGLSAPYHVTRGQRLVLPPSTVHIVAPGDTVSSIARSYGISRQAVVDANDFDAPDSLKPGQRVAIPFVGPRPRTAVASAPLKAPEPPAETGPDPRVLGARYYAFDGPRRKPVLDGQGGPEEYEAPKAKLAAVEPEKPVKRQKPVDDAPAADRRSARFIWPVQGKVISPFGRHKSGVQNDGINIAADPGTPVKAADDGVVVYDGNELAAYGNLLLVRHPSGYVTAYAHNKKLLVKRGDEVVQGETIALVGATGDVDRPQLHFEIRRGERAVDPKSYLARATASR